MKGFQNWTKKKFFCYAEFQLEHNFFFTDELVSSLNVKDLNVCLDWQWLKSEELLLWAKQNHRASRGVAKFLHRGYEITLKTRSRSTRDFFKRMNLKIFLIIMMESQKIRDKNISTPCVTGPDIFTHKSGLPSLRKNIFWWWF